MNSNEEFMRIAIEQASVAATADEVPVGAIIVKDGKVIARAHNLKESNQCALYHAEMVAMMRACAELGTWRLEDCDMYVTLEPCPMCAGAMINSRLRNLYFGAYDLKAGCCGTLYNLPEDMRFNHRLGVSGGLLERECGLLLTSYFKGKRDARKFMREQVKAQGIN